MKNKVNKGFCLKCEFYHEDRCKRAEGAFSTMVDPICLSKIQVMLLRDLCSMMHEYLFEDEESPDEPPEFPTQNS